MTDTGGNSIKVTPERLREVAPEFRRAAQETRDLLANLHQVARNLVYELYDARLTRSPDALDHIWNRWGSTITNLAGAMEAVANNLETSANNYEATDRHIWS